MYELPLKKVRFIRAWNVYSVGQVWECVAGRADWLIAQGFAEAIEAETAEAPAAPQTAATRTRRPPRRRRARKRTKAAI